MLYCGSCSWFWQARKKREEQEAVERVKQEERDRELAEERRLQVCTVVSLLRNHANVPH